MSQYTGFEECAVGRVQYGEMLTNLIKNSENEELVIALNAAWGEGKTTFIEHWQKMLQAEKVPHISIDAFAHDHLDDAFFPIASAIYEYLEENSNKKSKTEAITNTMASVGLKVGNFFLGAGKHAAKKYLGDEASEILLGDKGDDLQNSAAKGISKEIENQTNLAFDTAKNMIKGSVEDKENIETLKSSLSEIYKLCDPDPEDKEYRPFVIIIDELDRCRPDFALSILEKIKHLFSVPNVIFVLSMNSHQIEKSIEHIYGQGINAKEYLEKFITLEFTLPKKTTKEERYNGHTFNYYMQITNEMVKELKFNHHVGKNINFYNHDVVIQLFELYGLSFRTIKQLLKHIIFSIKVSKHGFHNMDRNHILSYFVGYILKIKHPDLFHKAVENKLFFEDLKSECPSECFIDDEGEQNRMESFLMQITSQDRFGSRSPLFYACNKLNIFEVSNS